MLTDRAGSVEFQQFLEQIQARYAGQALVLVMDNAAYHKSVPIRTWLAEHREQMQVLFQPTYSPHLNPIERVWRMLKHRLACHAFWNDRAGLRQHTTALLASTVARIRSEASPAITMGWLSDPASPGASGPAPAHIHPNLSCQNFVPSA